MKCDIKVLETDVLIIGGGTAGCFSAITIAEQSNAKVIIAEKAHIKRSGCLAAGVNALNAYINRGETPESYVQYVKQDCDDVIREDLVYTCAKRLNKVTEKVEGMGLAILKENGSYAARGRFNIKINGENIKPILAKAVEDSRSIQVLNRVNIVGYIMRSGKVAGAYGFSTLENVFYYISSKAVICSTGGASGLYKPNNPGASRHKMWYSPFNVGAGFAMGIRAGAEMTTFEMRFIALRCKDTIAPTGTIAQILGVKQVNSLGREYVSEYGRPTTPVRLHSTVQENIKGRGPCYLSTKALEPQQEEDLLKAYLNMAPAQTLKWIETGKGPKTEDVEIEGTEPYVFGGHTGGGYWIDTKRETTLPGLFAAGDVAGGSPHKFVTGCFAEGEIAAQSALEYIKNVKVFDIKDDEIKQAADKVFSYFSKTQGLCGVEELEEAMQKTMDQYAGGIGSMYSYNRKKLEVAKNRIEQLEKMSHELKANDSHELLQIYELLDRLLVCRVLIEHMKAREETRWLSFQQDDDFPIKNDKDCMKYVNSRLESGAIKIIIRNLTGRDDIYEHKN